jgi:hypothetical protein
VIRLSGTDLPEGVLSPVLSRGELPGSSPARLFLHGNAVMYLLCLTKQFDLADVQCALKLQHAFAARTAHGTEAGHWRRTLMAAVMLVPNHRKVSLTANYIFEANSVAPGTGFAAAKVSQQRERDAQCREVKQSLKARCCVAGLYFLEIWAQLGGCVLAYRN